MPIRKLKQTRQERQAYLAAISRLKELNILPQSAGGHLHLQPSLRLRSLQGEDAHICELPSGEVGVMLPVEILPLMHHMRIDEPDMILPWETPEFDFENPEHNPYYSYLLQRLYFQPATVLNRWVCGDILPHRKLRGVVLGYACTEIPRQWADGMPVPITFVFQDDRGVEYQLKFQALPYSLRRSYERKREEHARLYPQQRTGLFGPAREQSRGVPAVTAKDIVTELASSGAADLKAKQSVSKRETVTGSR
jgi:hypothetical protein